jgi:hypothetical protein
MQEKTFHWLRTTKMLLHEQCISQLCEFTSNDNNFVKVSTNMGETSYFMRGLTINYFNPASALLLSLAFFLHFYWLAM